LSVPNPVFGNARQDIIERRHDVNKGSNNGPGDVKPLPLKPLIEQIEQAVRRPLFRQMQPSFARSS